MAGIPSNDLNISQPGYVVFDGVSTFTGRTFQAGNGISLTNATGIAGNTTITSSKAAYNTWLFNPISNVTGDATIAPVTFSIGDVNNGGFGGTAAAPVIPITGSYQVSWVCEAINAVSGVNTVGQVYININGTAYGGATFNPGAIVNTSYLHSSVSGSMLMNLTAGDIITMSLQVFGGAKTVGIGGAINSTRTTQMNIVQI